MNDEMMRVICRGCDLPIEGDDLVASVMVRVFVPKLRQYLGDGPFHEECGKLHDTQSQANLKTPNGLSDRLAEDKGKE